MLQRDMVGRRSEAFAASTVTRGGASPVARQAHNLKARRFKSYPRNQNFLMKSNH